MYPAGCETVVPLRYVPSVNQSPTERTATAVRVELARQKVRAADLARLLGLSRATISRRLEGVHAFRVNELVAVAEHLGVPVSTLLPDEEQAA
jgi:transcriptional regulator with XRE-family HTH domain